MEKYVNALPAYLANRCYVMQGSRGANTRKRGGDLKRFWMQTKWTYQAKTQIHEKRSAAAWNTATILHPQLLYKEPPSQEQPSQFSLQQQSHYPLDFIPPSGIVALENFEYVLLLYLNTILKNICRFVFNIFFLFSGPLQPHTPLFK